MTSEMQNSLSEQNNASQSKDEIINHKNFNFKKDENTFLIEVYQKRDIILIKYSNYEIQLNPEELSKIFSINLNTINEAYNSIINFFIEKKVVIKDIIKDNRIKLIFDISNDSNENKKIHIDLIHIKQNKDYIIIDLVNRYNCLQKEVISLKNDFIVLKDKIIQSRKHKDSIYKEKNKVMEEIRSDTTNNKNENLKEKNDKEDSLNKEKNDENKISENNTEQKENKNIIKNDNIINNENEEIINKETNINNNEEDKIEQDEIKIDLNFRNDLTTNSFCSNIEDNTFCLFKCSIDQILYLIYSTKSKTIIVYNLLKQLIVHEIENPHEGEYITNYRHCIYNNRDIIMSVSLSNNLIKIWKFKDFSCILTLKNVNTNGYLYSACFLNNDNTNINDRFNYIITSCAGSNDQIKIFDFDGCIIKRFEQKNYEDVYFIDSYYDLILKKYFIITGNYNYIKSYDFYQTKLYKEYSDSSTNNHGSHCSCAIYTSKNKDENVVKLIDLCYGSEIICIWNFHSGDLISKIQTDGIGLISCCLWKENYIFVGCKDRTIKLIDISKDNVIQNLKGHNNWVTCVKKIKHPEYGECMISQGDLNDQIKFWVNKSFIK